jgi:polyphenol oxidase
MFLHISKLLSQYSGLKAFMTTKAGINSPYYFNMSYSVKDNPENVKNNREIFFNATGILEDRIVFPKQTHSDNVLVVSEPGVYPECDGLITKEADLHLSISIADCVPIYIFDKENRFIGIIHSGWRGTSKKILSKAIEIFLNDFKSKEENINVFLGPCGSKCCYEVGADIAEYFSPEVLERKDETHFYLDLKKDNYNQLKHYGIPDQNIEISEYCTICTSMLFHSFRRDGEHSGRMMAIFGLEW